VTVAATAQALRPRTGAEILDAAVPLLRRSYASCLAVWLAHRVIYDAAYRAYFSVWPLWVRYVVGTAWAAVPYAVLLVLSADAYLGRPVRIDRALVRVARRLGALYVAFVLRWALVLFGVLCLVVPGLLYWGMSFAAIPAVILEDCPPLRAIGRSQQLARGELGRIIWVLGITVVLGYAVLWGETLGYRLAITAHLLNRPVGQAVFTVVTSLFSPFVPAVVVVLYYDLRIRKEGFDLELMARSVM
jgi:hypothetical protein